MEEEKGVGCIELVKGKFVFSSYLLGAGGKWLGVGSKTEHFILVEPVS